MCLVGWLAIGVATVRIASRTEQLSVVPLPRVAGAVAALVLAAAALVGYWRMRRWGLWLLALGLGARVAAGLAGWATLRLADVAWPALLLVVGLFFVRRLR